jgi:hypothetical protein
MYGKLNIRTKLNRPLRAGETQGSGEPFHTEITYCFSVQYFCAENCLPGEPSHTVIHPLFLCLVFLCGELMPWRTYTVVFGLFPSAFLTLSSLNLGNRIFDTHFSS